MRYLDFLRVDKKKIVFVWDEEDRVVESADKFAKQIENSVVHSVRAMPHESIYSLGTRMHPSRDMVTLERQQHLSYWNSVKLTELLSIKSKFEVLFGDRIEEVVRYATLVNAEYVLTQRFEQASFSKWIHGDLDLRLAQKVRCPVIFINAKSGSWTSVSGADFSMEVKQK